MDAVEWCCVFEALEIRVVECESVGVFDESVEVDMVVEGMDVLERVEELADVCDFYDLQEWLVYFLDEGDCKRDYA